MNRTTYLLGTLVLGLLIMMSCSSEPTRWYRAGTTQAMYERDKADCEEQTQGTLTSTNKVDTFTFESCMERRGYVALDHTAM